MKDDDGRQIAEGKRYALRSVELGADDAYALSRAAHFFGFVLKDAEMGDTIADQALAVNPNLAVAWALRGWVSAFLGQHEAALEQFQYAMRLNPLDPFRYSAEAGLAAANFFLHRFEIALSWATKALARKTTYATGERIAMASYAMLGRVVDAQMMAARMRDTGSDMTISQMKRWIPYRRQEDSNLFVEAYRIAGIPD